MASKITIQTRLKNNSLLSMSQMNLISSLTNKKKKNMIHRTIKILLKLNKFFLKIQEEF